jgi:hypothetical protein
MHQGRRNMRIGAFAIGLALACAAIGGARATEVQFTISGGDGIATFELNPTSGFDEGFLFVFPPVLLTVGGAHPTSASVSLTFFSKEFGGEFGGGFLADPFFFFTKGPQFYSESGPTFDFGTYKGLVNAFTGKTDIVTISPISDPPDPPDPPALGTPELSTWAMLLLGFVGLSYAGYKKAKRRTTVSA